MLSRLEVANRYIRENKHRVTNRPHYHFAAEIGWINDPNGFIHYNGEYHLFYQYNPYSTVWRDIHWGHAATKDFIRWDYKPVALANDRWYDANGCFSGSAVEKDGMLYLMYTGHVTGEDGRVVQRQCLAVSEDGIHFEKHPANPVIGERELPDRYMPCDFRDPKVWREADGHYYCVLAVRNEQRRGEIVMFRSEDLVHWRFHSSVYRTEEAQNLLLECPDFFHLDGKDVLIFSVMPCDPEYAGQVANHVAYAVGRLDFGTGRFEPEARGVLDRGPSFYAPQTTAGPGGERLLIGWMQSWRQGGLPDGFEFNGMMTIPRRLRVEGAKLLQQPFLPNGEYFAPVHSGEAELAPGRAPVLLTSGSGRILLELDRAEAEELKGNVLEFRLQEKDGRAIRVEVDAAAGQIAVRNDYEDGEPGRLDVSTDGGLALELFVDLYSLELFVNGGEQVFSLTSYAPKGFVSKVSAARPVRLRRLESFAFRPPGRDTSRPS
jgi:beta-fructofuranosidase